MIRIGLFDISVVKVDIVDQKHHGAILTMPLESEEDVFHASTQLNTSLRLVFR